MTKTADNSAVALGGLTGYTIYVSNSNDTSITVTGISDTLPAGFSYAPGSSTGATTADPSIVGQKLSWTGSFAVPASGNISLHFNVYAASVSGPHCNSASGTASSVVVVPASNAACMFVGPTPTPTFTPTPCPGGKVRVGGGCGTPTPSPTPCPEGKVSFGGGCGTPTPTFTPGSPTPTPTTKGNHYSLGPTATATATATSTSTVAATASATATATRTPTATTTILALAAAFVLAGGVLRAARRCR
jgi:uncharacterized repeat protein (TIGR01451 family)